MKQIRARSRSVSTGVFRVTFLLSLFVVIFTCPSMAQVSNTTDVFVNIAEAIEVLQWPLESFILSENAVPGIPLVSEVLTFRVRSNSTWGITIASDQADGLLREYTTLGNFYIDEGKISKEPLEWSTSPSGPWNPLSSIPATIVTDCEPTGDAGMEVSFYLRFIPTFDDMGLSSDTLAYRVSLIYTAGVGY